MSVSRITQALVILPRWLKKIIILALDIALCFFTTWLAFSLRFDYLVPLSEALIVAAAASIIALTPIFFCLGLYHAIFRHSGWFETRSLVIAVSIYTFFYATTFFFISVEGVPRSIGIIQPILLFVMIGLSRLGAKYIFNNCVLLEKYQNKRTISLIYGAGSAGRQIVSGLRQSLEIKPIGFIDDDSTLWKTSINGLPVYAPSDLPALLQSERGLDSILLAMPSLKRNRQKEILTSLSNLPIHVRILPSLSDLANGIVRIGDIREVEVEDVLGREPVKANQDLLSKNITNKVVLVTGAGGSIGSELSRQILAQKPKTLILFDLSEFGLYAIERELTQLNNTVTILPVLGSVLDADKLNRVCSQLQVQTLFHAAAYKHVPMIEMNPSAGIWNNVFGTLRAVDAACKCGIETFVLVSTDKAVRPSNIMGCSKRIAELVLQAKSLQQIDLGIKTTKLTMVRFGNVLDSSGSVVPVFREQIKKGGPVTVTHPEIIRYFMTIPEAAQLVIQAGALGEGGDVMVLDMGEPIKIVDLAKRMINLSGFSLKDEKNLNGDIEIQYSGLRPGEKLYEELLIEGNTLQTSHSRIMRAVEQTLTWFELEQILVQLEVALKAEDNKSIFALIKKAVPEFTPQT